MIFVCLDSFRAQRVDDWSNTYIALHTREPGGAEYKYGIFDPYGAQSAFSTPYMWMLFDLRLDPWERHNIYNKTKAANPGLVAALDRQLRALYTCAGASCN